MRHARYRRPTHAIAAFAAALTCSALLASGCGDTEEAARYDASFATVAHDGPVTNDLGWQVELGELRAVVQGIELTTEGEFHDGDDDPLAAVGDALVGLFVSEAHAHPGHEAGGTVIGELPGRRILDLQTATNVGDAVVLEGRYDGMNLTFGVGTADDGLADDDPLVGASVSLAGVARRDGVEVPFTARIEQEDGRRVVGVPLALEVLGEGSTIGISVALADPFESAETAFDGVDFGALELDADGTAHIEPGAPDHNRIRNALQAHDHWLGHAL